MQPAPTLPFVLERGWATADPAPTRHCLVFESIGSAARRKPKPASRCRQTDRALDKVAHMTGAVSRGHGQPLAGERPRLPDERGFEFLCPRILLSGPGKAAEVGSALSVAGVAPGAVVVVADEVVAKAGLTDSTVEGIRQAGFETLLLGEVAGEPDESLVQRLVQHAVDTNPTAIVGVGGGSAMDTAKLLALLVRNTVDIRDLGGVVLPKNAVAPIALVPTTTGTGSEATRIAMVSVCGNKRIVSCVQFVPAIAALDPHLVVDLPQSIVSSTAFDALSHAVESTLSSNRTPLTEALATHATRIILSNVERAVLDDDAEAKGLLLQAAYVAGVSL